MRQRACPPPVSMALTLLATGLLLLATEVARADTQYKIQQIVKLGDTVAGINVKRAAGALTIYGLTDRGQIAFSTWVEGLPAGLALIQYADGKFTPIAVPDREGPVGTWPQDLIVWEPESMNQLGNLAFAAAAWNNGNGSDLGTFRWDSKTGKVTPVAREGMSAGSNLVFEAASGFSPAINNHDEIAFPAIVKDADGDSLGGGVFLARPDGQIVSVAIPGQALPDGRKISFAERPTLNDAGGIAFRAYREGDPDDGRNHAYLWEKGTITPLVAARADAPGGGKFASVLRAWVNDANRNVLIVARVNDPGSGPEGLYLWVEGSLTAVAVRGQEMPGGGQFKTLGIGQYSVGPPNRLGQHAFIATLADGSTAAYRMDADGKLSLVLKSGAATELGQITRIGRGPLPSGLSLAQGGSGIGLNSQGQVALPVQIDGGPFTIVVLTPATQ